MKHAYRIETERLIIRCYNPSDVFLLKNSIEESIEHLRPWMPWVDNEPEELQVKIDRLRMFRGEFDLDKNYVYGIFNPDENQLIGGCGLHPRIGDNALEIGYWINVNHINRGYATEIATALTKVAFEIENVQRVEIHCDPKNVRSSSIPRKLGFTHEATLKQRNVNYKGEFTDSMIWTLFKDQYLKSSIKERKMKIFDAIGKKL